MVSGLSLFFFFFHCILFFFCIFPTNVVNSFVVKGRKMIKKIFRSSIFDIPCSHIFSLHVHTLDFMLSNITEYDFFIYLSSFIYFNFFKVSFIRLQFYLISFFHIYCMRQVELVDIYSLILSETSLSQSLIYNSSSLICTIIFITSLTFLNLQSFLCEV